MLQLLFLFAAGFFGGVINSIASSGITLYFFYDVYGGSAAT